MKARANQTGAGRSGKTSLFGSGCGLAAAPVPGGAAVHATHVQPFSRQDITYFSPLYTHVTATLGHAPVHLTADAAFDAWRVYEVRTGGSEKGKASPEELIAAAHATCYSMALSFELQNAGFTAEKLEVTSIVTFGPKPGGGMKIESSALTLVGTVPGISAEQFDQFAQGAKTGCPVSGALAGNVEITLSATLS